MNRLKTFVTPALVAGALMFGALAVAQGGGQGRNRGFGGGGGGRQGNSLMLLRRSDVQADLKLTAEQKTKLEEILTSMRGQRGDRSNRNANGGSRGEGGQRTPPTDAEREARRAQMESRMAEMTKNINAVLTNDQTERLGEISLQLRGSTALFDEKVQKEIGLTSEQKTKIESLRDKMGEASRSIFQKMQDNSITREDAMKSMEKNNDILKGELEKVLSKSQSDKFKSMQGAAFKADPSESQRGFGFGGGRRGGGQGGGRRGGGSAAGGGL